MNYWYSSYCPVSHLSLSTRLFGNSTPFGQKLVRALILCCAWQFWPKKNMLSPSLCLWTHLCSVSLCWTVSGHCLYYLAGQKDSNWIQESELSCTLIRQLLSLPLQSRILEMCLAPGQARILGWYFLALAITHQSSLCSSLGRLGPA